MKVKVSLAERNLLLIVPYGIEMTIEVWVCLFVYLLIVPYGIEINRVSLTLFVVKLLIVPYGIEMQFDRVQT